MNICATTTLRGWMVVVHGGAAENRQSADAAAGDRDSGRAGPGGAVMSVEIIAITELAPEDNRFAGKRILRNNDFLPFSGAMYWHQNVARIPATTAALLDYLSEARSTRNVILIRDAPANPGRQPTRRQKAGGERGDHGFHDTPTRLFPVDIDKARINWRDDPEAAVRRLRLLLGETFASASCVWHFTASHGLEIDNEVNSIRKRWTGRIADGVMHVRLLFITDRPLNSREAIALTGIAKQHSGLPVDEAIARRVQPIYIRRPLWDEHPDRDPLGDIPTIGLIEGVHDTLAVPDDLVPHGGIDSEDDEPLAYIADTPFADDLISPATRQLDDDSRLALRAVSPQHRHRAARPAQPAAVERQRDAMVPQRRVQPLHPRGQGRLLVQPLGKRRRRHDQPDHARAELLVRRGARLRGAVRQRPATVVADRHEGRGRGRGRSAHREGAEDLVAKPAAARNAGGTLPALARHRGSGRGARGVEVSRRMPVRRPDRSGAGGAGARHRHRRAGRDPPHAR